MMYRAGHLLNPKPTDPVFEEKGQAVEAATAASKDGDVWAVWDEDGTPTCLIYDGWVFYG
jgi:hypothetical protein